MTEIKNVKNIKFSLEKQKGTYTGQAIGGVLSSTPEGFGKAVFKDGVCLDGRFKEGNFVSGKASISDGTVFEGEFDNKKWLGGNIKFRNGDFLIGKINPKSRELEIDKFRITQEFGDVFEGEFVQTENGLKEIVGTQTFVDGSVLTGTFSMRKANPNGAKFERKFVENQSFGITKPVFECIKAKADIKVFQDEENNQNSATLVGDFENGKITGVFTLSHATFQSVLKGDFDFNRNSTSDPDFHKISEDFGGFFENHEAKTPYIYGIDLKKGDISMTDGTESFKATKIIGNDGKIGYHGTFSSSRLRQNLVGDFFDDLSVNNVKLLIENQNSKLIGKLCLGKNGYEFVGEHTFFNGDFKKGKFGSEVKFDKNENGMPKQIFIKNNFLSGNFRQTLKKPDYDTLVFEGVTRDLMTMDDGKNFDITQKPAVFEKQNGKLMFFGKLLGTRNDVNVLLKTGLFDANFELLEGHIEEETISDEQTILVNGDKKFNEKKEERFFGKTAYPVTEDFFEGEFLPDYTFLSGKMKVTIENKAIFEASTTDMTNFSGKLERKNDFWQEGEFKINAESNMIEFLSGKTMVFFNRPDKAKCFAYFDKNGFDDFGKKQYICLVSSAKQRQVVDMFAADSINDAINQYDKKLLGEHLIAKSNTSAKDEIKKIVEPVKKTAENTNTQSSNTFGQN